MQLLNKSNLNLFELFLIVRRVIVVLNHLLRSHCYHLDETDESVTKTLVQFIDSDGIVHSFLRFNNELVMKASSSGSFLLKALIQKHDTQKLSTIAPDVVASLHSYVKQQTPSQPNIVTGILNDFIQL